MENRIWSLSTRHYLVCVFANTTMQLMLPLSTWIQHEVAQVKGSVPQDDCPLQTPVTNPGCHLCFILTGCKSEAPLTPPLTPLSCWGASQNSGKYIYRWMKKYMGVRCRRVCSRGFCPHGTPVYPPPGMFTDLGAPLVFLFRSLYGALISSSSLLLEVSGWGCKSQASDPGLSDDHSPS